MATVVTFIWTYSASIVGVILGLVGVYNPSPVPADQRGLEILAAVFLALGVGGISARLAVRSEARLGLVSPSRD